MGDNLRNDSDYLKMNADELQRARLAEDFDGEGPLRSLGRTTFGVKETGREALLKAQRARIDAQRQADGVDDSTRVEHGGNRGSSTRNDDGTPRITF